MALPCSQLPQITVLFNLMGIDFLFTVWQDPGRHHQSFPGPGISDSGIHCSFSLSLPPDFTKLIKNGLK